MTDKQIEEEIKQVVTNLGNIEFTVEDELNFCKKVLKAKEQKLAKIKEYCKPKVTLNSTAKVILQIIEGKENE